MWINRDISKIILDSSKKRPVILKTGARQTGKTSLAKRIFKDYNYISLDLPNLAREADESGESFLSRYKSPLVIDEVQYAPELFRYLKHAVDQKRSESGLYVLTGSQRFILMEQISESLAGRLAVFDCHSLSCKELVTSLDLDLNASTLDELIVKGGYPEIYEKNLEPYSFYADYLVTYLERDVRQIVNVRNIRDFDRFLRLAASRSGQLMNIGGFASDIGISPNTVKSWLSILEASGIILLVEPWYENFGKRIVKSPKLFFLDTGILCHLLAIRDSKDLRLNPMWGHIFETYVLGQLVRKSAAQAKREPIYFFRDHSGLEVDFVRLNSGRLELIEVKTAENPADKTLPFEKMKKIAGDAKIASCKVITPANVNMIRRSGVVVSNVVDL